ncbi:MAG: YebC/PmpR family DNA-binding transcriptional regulator [Chlamydiae bacterium]|nr:YebC/PmpR family DNA-binding transcriptional regulator [Chlamydiota bacterium]
MAGHSKWANIKHRKSRADAAKGKLFSRLMKEIINAVKQGGPDPKMNSKLRMVLQKAKAANLPNENIEKNIKKAANASQANFEPVVYELYGYGGVGIIAEGLTDNKNRTASDIRIAINKKGGTIAAPGAVTFNFDRKGIIQVARKNAIEDELFLAASESGAEDFQQQEDFYLIITVPEELYQVKERLENLSVKIEEESLEMIPKTWIECNEENTKANLELIEWLEGIDDIDVVYHNMKL